jgi:hypothetical protein
MNKGYLVSESEFITPVSIGKIASQAIYSNIKQVVEQEQYVFDNLWNKTIFGAERIKEIEERLISLEYL